MSGGEAVDTPVPGERDTAAGAAPGVGLWPLAAYFLKLGTLGFGGPVALVWTCFGLTDHRHYGQ